MSNRSTVTIILVSLLTFACDVVEPGSAVLVDDSTDSTYSTDSDCDDLQTDVCETPAACACVPGSQIACDSGDCQTGMRTCNAMGTGYGACIGEVSDGDETETGDAGMDGAPIPDAGEPAVECCFCTSDGAECLADMTAAECDAYAAATGLDQCSIATSTCYCE